MFRAFRSAPLPRPGSAMTGVAPPLGVGAAALLWAALCFSQDAAAAAYALRNADDSLVGAVSRVRAKHEDTLADLARLNGLGHSEIRLANPGVDIWLPGRGTEVVLPNQFVLPAAPRRGIVLNIPEMRLYYFPPANEAGLEVVTYPLGVGREGWSTPYLSTRIIQKKIRPAWHPPESVRKEHAEQGDPLPERVEPGPDNPLGNYAMRLGLPQYLIHGTNKPYGIGMRVSHGCIRLYPEDIESLFAQVELGTPVRIVNQPFKVGRHEGKLYLEAHPYLAEDAERFEGNLTSVVGMLVRVTGDDGYVVDWDLAKAVIAEKNGMPAQIGEIIATAKAEDLPYEE